MKTLSRAALLCLGVMSISSASFAADEKWEFWLTNLASINFATNFNGQGPTSTNINLFNNGIQSGGLQAGYLIAPGLEFIVSPSFNSTSANSVTITNWTLMGGFNYSFMAPLEDAVFIQAQAGINSSSTSIAGSLTASNFTWQAELGKRFKLADHVTFAPALAYSSTGTTPTTGNFSILPLQFTLLL